MSKQYTFDTLPKMKRRRTAFDLSHSVYTSQDIGDLVPYDIYEIYPGSTLKVDSRFMCRGTQAFRVPTMQSLYLDQQFFFVPFTQILDTWKNVMGESDKAWTSTKTYRVPVMDVAYSNLTIGKCKSVANYLGIPPVLDAAENLLDAHLYRSVLPFRAFAKVYNDWYRDENLEPPMALQTGEGDSRTNLCAEKSGVMVDKLSSEFDEWTPTNYVGRVPKVSKLHDYFTSALPSPQKGDPVYIPSGLIPVTSESTLHSVGSAPLIMVNGSGSPESVPKGPLYLSEDNVGAVGSIYTGSTPAGLTMLYPGNLYATGALFDIEDFRYSAMLQRLYERDARGGTRYNEYIMSAFGTCPPDMSIGRCEYLGGARNPLNIQQVAQTAQTTDGETGDLGAYSLTVGSARMIKSFTQHGYVLACSCIRTKPLYQQGIAKFWSRVDREDFFDPIFANLGEQPIYESEIYAPAAAAKNSVDTATMKLPHGNDSDAQIFGYQEAWADLRQKPDTVSGALRTAFMTGLDLYHFGEHFANKPTLNESFIKQGTSGVYRAFAVEPNENEPPFAIQYYNKAELVAVGLPPHSIPSLRM